MSEEKLKRVKAKVVVALQSMMSSDGSVAGVGYGECINIHLQRSDGEQAVRERLASIDLEGLDLNFVMVGTIEAASSECS